MKAKGPRPQEKKDVPKAPAYKLGSDVQKGIDLEAVLEERLLDCKLKVTVRELLA